MSVHSLRRRLLTGTLAWVLASIALAGWGLRELFVSHITEQLQEQLLVQLPGIVCARPAVSEREPFQDRLGVAIQMLLPGNAEIIGHGQGAE